MSVTRLIHTIRQFRSSIVSCNSLLCQVICVIGTSTFSLSCLSNIPHFFIILCSFITLCVLTVHHSIIISRLNFTIKRCSTCTSRCRKILYTLCIFSSSTCHCILFSFRVIITISNLTSLLLCFLNISSLYIMHICLLL